MLGLLGVAALVEHFAEAKDKERYASHETYVDIAGGARVRYRLLGTGLPGPAVVLLNGVTASVEQWDRTQLGIARSSPVLAFDGAGTGYSSGSLAHDAQGEADEMALVLKALHIQGKVVVVGFSASGSVARVFAARHPELSAGCVLLVPYLPEMDVLYPERRGELRNMGRGLFSATLESAFGTKRVAIQLGLLHLDPEPKSELDFRANAVLMRFSHWWAVDRQVLAAKDSAQQALASHSDAPLIVLRSNVNDTPHYPETVDSFTAAHRGELRIIDGIPHSVLLDDPRSVALLVQAIADLAYKTRAP